MEIDGFVFSDWDEIIEDKLSILNITTVENIHELFKYLPPCPESRRPDAECFIRFPNIIKRKHTSNSNSETLIPQLYEHNTYGIQYRTFKHVVQELGVVKLDQLWNVV